MSSLRPGRGHDSRKSVFYTSEEWELLDPSPKDLEESMLHEERKRQVPEGSRGITRRLLSVILSTAVWSSGTLQEQMFLEA